MHDLLNSRDIWKTVRNYFSTVFIIALFVVDVWSWLRNVRAKVEDHCVVVQLDNIQKAGYSHAFSLPFNASVMVTVNRSANVRRSARDAFDYTIFESPSCLHSRECQKWDHAKYSNIDQLIRDQSITFEIHIILYYE